MNRRPWPRTPLMSPSIDVVNNCSGCQAKLHGLLVAAAALDAARAEIRELRALIDEAAEMAIREGVPG